MLKMLKMLKSIKKPWRIFTDEYYIRCVAITTEADSTFNIENLKLQ